MSGDLSMNLNHHLKESFGFVISVDTKKVTISIEDEKHLNTLKLNDIVIFSGSNADEKLIGLITQVSKRRLDTDEDDDFGTIPEPHSENFANAVLVGTFYNKIGLSETNVFKRAVNTYPEINSRVHVANEQALFIVMNSVSGNVGEDTLKIGSFASNTDVQAILDGNKFFQRHAAIVGSTGSGKSYTVATILEKINSLQFSNAIVFDLHGEYNELSYAEHIKIDANGLKTPLWFFNYEEIHSLFIESSEGTSANQRAVVIDYILQQKKQYIQAHISKISPDIITADTPIPFSAFQLKKYLEKKNEEVIVLEEVYKSGERKGHNKTRQGNYYGKLTNLITRLQTKMDDKKYAFVFDEKDADNHEYLNHFARMLLCNKTHKVKIIDLSEVPSDILSIIIGIITRILYDIQFWMSPTKDELRHPLLLVCDEAHIYMSHDTTKLKAVERKSLEIFEKIAKEGRKYGIGLLIVSQRPSELNTTIVSQCNNILSLKIANDRDKSAVSSLLTESLEGLTELLPNLDIGECIAVGDAIMLPSKIILDKPQEPPKSSSIDFWDKWKTRHKTVFQIDDAIKNMIRQMR